MAYADLTRDDLQAMALAYVGETLTQNHYATNSLKWLDKGVKMMYDHTSGVQSTANYTLVPGQRYYRLPQGFIRARRINVNNQQINYHDIADLDYYATGNSLPAWYCFWGKPQTHLYLGPQPPDSPYAMTMWFLRSPSPLKFSTSVPELPVQWQEAPAYWAGAQLLMNDGQIALAEKLKEQFYQERAEFTKWYQNEDDGSYLQVSYASEY